MAISIRQLHPLFVGEVTGLDLRHPSTAMAAEIEATINRYAVLVFRGQTQLTDDGLLAFTQLLGPLERSGKSSLNMKRQKHLTDPRLSDISNVDENDQLLAQDDRRRMYNLGNQLWHTDASYRVVPAKFTLLHARVLPPTGGETEFADMRAAYEVLEPSMQTKIDGLLAEHSMLYSRARMGFNDFSETERATMSPVPQMLVRTHPGSRRRNLYLASHADRIIGWPYGEGRALIDELIAFATQPSFVYTHAWQAGDLVMWDDRCTMHRGLPWDDAKYRRDLRRTTVRDVASTIEQSRAA